MINAADSTLPMFSAPTMRLSDEVILTRVEPARVADRDGVTIPRPPQQVDDETACNRMRLFVRACFMQGSIE